MDIKEAYKVMQEASGIKVGDTVKLLRHFGRYEMGSSAIASNGAGAKRTDVNYVLRNKSQGNVIDTRDNDVTVKFKGVGSNWQFPFFALEVVESAKVIEVRYICDGKDVTDKLSHETKRSLK